MVKSVTNCNRLKSKVVDLTVDYLKYEINDYKMGRILNISQEIKGLTEDSVALDEDDLKDIIKFCVEEGFLEWDCSECPIQ